MINFKNVSLRRGKNLLLKEVNWTIYHKQRFGLIGANGTGKTSLFSLLLGNLQVDEGDLTIPTQLKLSHVAQETPAYERSLIDYVLDGDIELRRLENKLRIAEEKDDGEEIGKIHEQLSIIDAYTANARAGQLLAGLGFNQQEQQQAVKEFSGGWRVRLNLAKALMCPSDMLLLDEPTNHLDLDAILWLEQWLHKYHGTLLLISHDRDFLDKTVDHIAHIGHQHLSVYTGNYSTFEELRANELLIQQSAYEKQQKQVAHMQDFINRFKAKATKARQAQSRMKALARMELVSAVQTESAFQFEFKPPKQCPNPLIVLHQASVQYGDKRVLNNLNLSISPRERIAVLGPNGAGKSSLIKLLAGELAPHDGERTVSPGLKIGYFAQHQVDKLNLNETPIEHLRDIGGQSELEMRKYLGTFDFTGDRVFEPVHHFSGGEKSRLALALIVWQRPNLLLLDEPTNHLDLEMRNALSIALQAYEGSMILVSHDRFLVRTTTDQLLLVANQQLQEFDGDLNDYQRWLLDFRKQQTKSSTSLNKALSKKEQRQQNAKNRASHRPLQEQITRLEKELDRLQKKAAEIEIVLADKNLYEENQNELLQTTLRTQADLLKQIEEVEKAWLNAHESD